MKTYRITTPLYIKQLAASGRAARWNSRDIKMVYTAQSRALACLENIVHRTLDVHSDFICLEIEIPNDLYITYLTKKNLFAGWQNYENMHHTQRIGDEWIKEGKSAILQVPSVIIPEEYNLLLNPRHEGFKHIHIVKREPFIFDERLK